MDTARYLDCLRKKYNIESTKIELDAIFRKYPEIDPNDGNLDDADVDRRPLLHILIDDDLEEYVDFVVNKATIKADIHTIDGKTGLTPLCMAIQNVNDGIVKILVDAGADVNQTSDSMTPILLAASQGQNTMIEYLVKAGGDLNKQGEELNIYGSPMHMACLCNLPETVEFLLDPGLQEGYNPLTVCSARLNYGALNVFHVCAKQNSVDCFQIIYAFIKEYLKEDTVTKVLNFRNRQGNTPIHEAASAGHRQILQHLLATGRIDETIKNCEGMTYLEIKESLEATTEPAPTLLEQQQAEHARLEEENKRLQARQDEIREDQTRRGILHSIPEGNEEVEEGEQDAPQHEQEQPRLRERTRLVEADSYEHAADMATGKPSTSDCCKDSSQQERHKNRPLVQAAAILTWLFVAWLGIQLCNSVASFKEQPKFIKVVRQQEMQTEL